jgi:uncharacterized phiE125 gp8 family phage protein
MTLKLITAPATEPITIAEAKLHLRVDSTDDDTLITALIVAARQGAEHITGRALMPQTWELALDEFEDIIRLRKAPLTSITSIKYLDTAGVLQTLTTSDYLLDDHSEPARVMPAYGASWPSTRDQANAVLVRFAAGYANAVTVPQEIKSWMLLRIGMLYENRESVAAGVTLAEVPYVDCLLDAYRIWGL